MRMGRWTGNAHEFGVEENLRKTIKQPGTGWAWYTCMEAMGGGIFAKTAKTPPLQSGVCGDIIAVRVPPIASPPCAYHAVYGDVRFS